MAARDHSHLLVCLRYGIGDLITQLPALRALRQDIDGRLALLGAEPAIELLEGEELGDEVRSYQSFGVDHMGTHLPPGQEPRLREWLDSFDAVLDALAAPATVQNLIWQGGQTTYDADRARIDAVLADGGGAALAIAEGARFGWGLRTRPQLPPALSLESDAELPDPVRRVRELPVPPVAVAPFAALALKRWPVERFAGVVDRLPAERAVAVLEAPGDPSARELVDRLTRPRPVDVVPPLHLRHTAALLASSCLLLCNDTGVMHLAAAVGTATVAIFGPTDPAVYGPGGGDGAVRTEYACPEHRDGSLQPPDCWAHGTCIRGLRSCIDHVPVEAVAERVLERLGEIESLEAA